MMPVAVPWMRFYRTELLRPEKRKRIKQFPTTSTKKWSTCWLLDPGSYLPSFCDVDQQERAQDSRPADNRTVGSFQCSIDDHVNKSELYGTDRKKQTYCYTHSRRRYWTVLRLLETSWQTEFMRESRKVLKCSKRFSVYLRGLWRLSFCLNFKHVQKVLCITLSLKIVI